MAFTFEETAPEGVRIARISGEIDRTTSDEFKSHLLESGPKDSPDLVVDLTDVRYMDSSAVGVLVGVEGRLMVRNGLLAIVIPEGNLRRLFSVAGLDKEMALFSTPPEACAWIEASRQETRERAGIERKPLLSGRHP